MPHFNNTKIIRLDCFMNLLDDHQTNAECFQFSVNVSKPTKRTYHPVSAICCTFSALKAYRSMNWRLKYWCKNSVPHLRSGAERNVEWFVYNILVRGMVLRVVHFQDNYKFIRSSNWDNHEPRNHIWNEK